LGRTLWEKGVFANNLDFEELEENGKKYEIISVFAGLKVDGSIMN
jgi:hypothetical protein